MTQESPNYPTWTVVLFVVAALLGVAYVTWLASGMERDEPTATAVISGSPSGPEPSNPPPPPPPTHTPQPIAPSPTNPGPSPTAKPQKVGVVAGHWQSDSGAVCPDGLQEVTINLDVASRVVAILQHEGYDAELMAELSDRLDGYKADAFISIHADSCGVPEATGFKVARVASSAIPEEEDRFVDCLIREYSAATGLRFHKDSITYDMTDYHAFNEIDPETPGVIIELGFMEADREILTEHAYEVAQGVARGIACFLEGR